jgi:uncharacterized membrane protein
MGDVRMEKAHAETAEEKETGRLEAFSDGVFAIAITLLVLELKVPAVATAGLTPAALGNALLQQWPSYLSLVTSFFTILVMWIHHHAIFRNVRRTDPWLHFANGFLLLMITFVPYPTSVLAAYWRTPAVRMAAIFYSGTFVVIAGAFILLAQAAFRKKLLAASASEQFIEHTRASYRLGVPAYLLAMFAAFIDAHLTVGICAGLLVFYAVSISKDTRA